MEKKIIDRRFEYMVAPLAFVDDAVDEIKAAELEMIGLSIYGQDHWELIGVHMNKAYFKREYYMK